MTLPRAIFSHSLRHYRYRLGRRVTSEPRQRQGGPGNMLGVSFISGCGNPQHTPRPCLNQAISDRRTIQNP
jgi:hypothetical protein